MKYDCAQHCLHFYRNPKGIIGYGLYDYKPLEYEGYIYPTWANVLGWCIAGSSIAVIPAFAVYQILITPGTFAQVYTRRSPFGCRPLAGLNFRFIDCSECGY